ncbi:pyridoxamine 5'-phosphate oxidase-related, FMN-binding protein [Myxococcus stipitatus DSM 14675]|uniref:Pyridoxamine 5'-phosphate oxidase-related, FMN-binding protein n=1 Tax=Myxococcus stipitatus (strain DSM 14675 / JCM 12634 / Mx s8) TaxID=1278073 RepID=L7UB96_MYXSD|nr:pyridoxamine 5'-phosphate oxidase family protein [Myxococcus stipitatus]AGC45150.1 pyridoxamine 5'-phosphate oxidase-related, FMN-binding protein [Myxococcus stipitatus DSM 14675]
MSTRAPSAPSIEEQWPDVRRLFSRATATSLHFSIASIDRTGAPHVTPIGSVLLTRPGRGFFFELYTRRLPANLVRDPRVSILAVDSGKLFWLQSLYKGRFERAPALRLVGRVLGPPRPSTSEEQERFARRVRRLSWLKGHALMWRDPGPVREFEVDRIEHVHLGPMTAGLMT